MRTLNFMDKITFINSTIYSTIPISIKFFIRAIRRKDMVPFYQIQKKDLTLQHNFRELKYPSHMHKEIEIIYMREGRQKIHINNQEYVLNKGEAAIIFPEQLHDYHRETNNATEEIIILCSPEFYRNFFPDLSDKIPLNPILSQSIIHPDAVYALEHIQIEDSFIAQLAATIMIITRFLENIELKEIQKIYVKDISYRVMEYIRENYKCDLSLESIAKEFCVNKNYISHIFSKKLGINFRKYLGHLRVEHAANLLRTTDDKVAIIAKNSGFDSQRTFNRIFYEIFGVTPMDYRKNVTSDKD